MPVEEGAARIAALDAAIQIVPVIEDAQLGPGRADHVRDRLAHLDHAQIGEHAIQHADIGVARDDDGPVAGRDDVADQIPFTPQRRQRQFQGCDGGQRSRRADQQGAVNRGPVFDRRGGTQHAGQTTIQLCNSGAQCRRYSRRLQQGNAVLATVLCLHRFIPQPQIVSGLGMRDAGKTEQRNRK